MKWIDVEILLIRAIIGVISLTGCIWHLSDISGIYFSYETDVNVDFRREIRVAIPGVTICLNTSLLVREDYLRTKFPEMTDSPLYKRAKYQILTEYLHKLSMYEQLHEATIGYGQLFNSCLIMKPVAFEGDTEQDYIECERVAAIRQYMTFAKKCFFIAAQLRGEPVSRYVVDHDSTLRDNGFPLYQIRLNNRFVQKPVLFLQPRTVPFLGFFGGQTNGLHLNNSKYSAYTFSYGKTSSRLLGPPYRTNCRDYTEIGFQSLSHCVVSCKAQYFVNHFGGWHADIAASDEWQTANGQAGSKTDNPLASVSYAAVELKQNKTLDKIMSDICGGSPCSHKMEDCESEHYTMISIGQFERENDRLFGVYIYLPTGINTRYTHSPRLRLIEYVCYFASVFSLWFGFSIVTISRTLINAYQYYSCRAGKAFQINGPRDQDLETTTPSSADPHRAMYQIELKQSNN